MRAGPKSECPSRATMVAEVRPKRRYARMKVLIGVDPHKASLAVAAVDEAKGELLERASFSQDRASLRALERWAKRFPERRWAVENAGGLGKHLSQRLAERLASRWWTWRPSFRHGCGCSRPATPARTMGWMPSPPRWPPGATNGCLRSPPRPERRCCACFPRGAKTWWLSVPGGSTASTGSCETSFPAGYPERSRPTEPRGSCAVYGPKASRPASAVDWLRIFCATSVHWSERSRT